MFGYFQRTRASEIPGFRGAVLFVVLVWLLHLLLKFSCRGKDSVYVTEAVERRFLSSQRVLVPMLSGRDLVALDARRPHLVTVAHWHVHLHAWDSEWQSVR